MTITNIVLHIHLQQYQQLFYSCFQTTWYFESSHIIHLHYLHIQINLWLICHHILNNKFPNYYHTIYIDNIRYLPTRVFYTIAFYARSVCCRHTPVTWTTQDIKYSSKENCRQNWSLVQNYRNINSFYSIRLLEHS